MVVRLDILLVLMCTLMPPSSPPTCSSLPLDFFFSTRLSLSSKAVHISVTVCIFVQIVTSCLFVFFASLLACDIPASQRTKKSDHCKREIYVSRHNGKRKCPMLLFFLNFPARLTTTHQPTQVLVLSFQNSFFSLLHLQNNRTKQGMFLCAEKELIFFFKSFS